MSPVSNFRFACPICGALLLPETHSGSTGAAVWEMRCPIDSSLYPQKNGVWCCLPPQLLGHYERFMQEYEQVRQAEGRGASGPEFYRALPFRDVTGRFSEDWRIRARSYEALVHRVLEPLEGQAGQAGKALLAADLGAGNGWLSYQLAKRGHQAAAIDLVTNPFDGLGAWVQYDAPFVPIQADFDHLPLQSGQLDVAVFNASLHYSTRYETTLCEAWRLLKPGGVLVILDSPIYHDAGSGEQMVSEREAHFQQKVGFPSNALASENYLTYERLNALEKTLGVRWQKVRPAYGWRWALRPWKARLRGLREPAQFELITAAKPE